MPFRALPGLDGHKVGLSQLRSAGEQLCDDPVEQVRLRRRKHLEAEDNHRLGEHAGTADDHVRPFGFKCRPLEAVLQGDCGQARR